MQIVLVLDRQAPSRAMKALEGLRCVPVVVNDVARARHVLLNVAIDLWICDLAVEDLDFRQLHSECLTRNASARILLTGSPLSQHLANALIKENRADQFLAKPWNPVGVKRMVLSLLEAPRPVADPGAAPSVATAPRQIITPRGLHMRVRPATAPGIPAAPPLIDEGRYRLDELVGEGGMGRVYRAHDRLLDMEVAIKLLNHEFSRDETAIDLLKKEARISLQLLHRHIVRLYNLERRQNLLLIIMEYVPGVSLNSYMSRMPRGGKPGLVLQIVSVMVDALGYAHRKGVLHKDITPGNVLISDDGVLKLIDFGIADRMNRQRVIPDYVIGTPVYMSPEQLRGETLDARTDVYSLGVLTHQLLTGRLPSVPEAPVEALAFQPHPPLEGFPDRVRGILEWALAFDPSGRCPAVHAFLAGFREACRQDYDADLAPADVQPSSPDETL